MFQDLKVIELASVLAGPSVGQFFAELGARVIKIENLKTGGDVTRSWKIAGEKEGDQSAYFCSCNWGKKSAALDLDTARGKEIVHKLAVTADVVIASYKPGDAEKLGVGYEKLRSVNEQIIYGQITGYGSRNGRVGYDAVIQAEAGFMDLNGEKNGPPVKMPVALIDILAAHQLKEGLLLTLLKKERTGKGGLVEVSLLQAASASLANQATNWLIAKKLPTRQGSSHPNIAPYGESFLTKDGRRILLAVGNDRQFTDLLKVLEAETPGQDRFAVNQHRVENREVLDVLLSDKIGQWNSEELLRRLNEKKIPAGLIQNMKQVFEMEAAKSILLQAGGLTSVRNFVATLPEKPRPILPPPKFGEHTEEVLNGNGWEQ